MRQLRFNNTLKLVRQTIDVGWEACTINDELCRGKQKRRAF